MTPGDETPSASGGHAEKRRLEFENQRGLPPEGELSLSRGDKHARFRGKAFLRQEEFREQRGLGQAPPLSPGDDGGGSLYQSGFEEKEELLSTSPAASAVTWRSLGPAGIPGGRTYGSGTTTVAGRISAIAVDPNDSQHLLIGSAAGGVWETKDTGTTWTPRTDGQPTLSIGAVAFDPTNPSTVYAGMGEGNWAYAQLGQGILRSSDGGSSWAVLPGSDIFVGHGFYRLVVDPSDGERILVATTGGALASSDAGATWGLLHNGNTWDLSLAQLSSGPEILLATPAGLFAAAGSAAPAPVALPGLPTSLERMAVTHMPADPGQAFVFAASSSEAFLWHRAAAGGPFTSIPLTPFGVGESVENAFSVKQAWYDWHVAAPPLTVDVVYLGAIELVKGERAGGSWQWSDISSREVGDSIHPDQHTMAFDLNDPKVIYAGNDGGIFRSSDGGDSWQSLNDGLAISEVEYLTQRPDDSTWIMAGLQDNGTVRREGEGEWAQVGLGDGGDCATDAKHPDTCFYSRYDMTLERSKSGGDPGSWEDVTPPGSEGSNKLFYPPLEVREELVVKAGDVVYLSSDSGDSWLSVPLPLAANGEPSIASALALPSANRVLVGTKWGDVFRIDRDGSGWGTPTALTLPKQGYISDMLVDADVPERYWVTLSSRPGAVLRFDDEGVGWVDVTDKLPSMPVNAVVTDPADHDRVWVACDVGVFESTGAGGGWSVYGTGLPNALAEDLLFYEKARLLRVGTRNRGVWEASVG
jgi:photosystem II stability/assembly factor-like uncharacterized protein